MSRMIALGKLQIMNLRQETDEILGVCVCLSVYTSSTYNTTIVIALDSLNSGVFPNFFLD